jgi:hypothetical protein
MTTIPDSAPGQGAPLTIPASAIDELFIAINEVGNSQEGEQYAPRVCAPVVAAELRRMADDIEQRFPLRVPLRREGLQLATRELRARADELDGGQS